MGCECDCGRLCVVYGYWYGFVEACVSMSFGGVVLGLVVVASRGVGNAGVEREGKWRATL